MRFRDASSAASLCGQPDTADRGGLQVMADVTEPPGRQGRADGESDAVPIGVNPCIPSPARMYDYYLGGKTNYSADRAAAEKALSAVPDGRRIARANRYFMMRAVLLMADQGIRQFLDLGTGILTSPSVHELAQALHPDARVLYVDNDAVVTAHNKALLTTSDNIRAMQADIRDPRTILNSWEARDLINFQEPVGVLFVAVLHFVRNRDNPRDIVRAFTSRMAPGSYLAVSHVTSDGTDFGTAAAVREAYTNASAPAVFRTKAEIGMFFSGFELVPPGLVDVTRWFPYAAMFTTKPSVLRFLAGLGQKLPGYKERPAQSEKGETAEDAKAQLAS
jgi:hypothetical protein